MNVDRRSDLRSETLPVLGIHENNSRHEPCITHTSFINNLLTYPSGLLRERTIIDISVILSGQRDQVGDPEPLPHQYPLRRSVTINTIEVVLNFGFTTPKQDQDVITPESVQYWKISDLRFTVDVYSSEEDGNRRVVDERGTGEEGGKNVSIPSRTTSRPKGHPPDLPWCVVPMIKVLRCNH